MMRFIVRVIEVMLALFLTQSRAGQAFNYPPTRQVNAVNDYQGVKIADPYRWLEELNSAETKEWVNAQSAITAKYLESLPLREVFRKRITELWDFPKVTVPWREGGRLWYRRNSGLQRQAVVYSRRNINAPRVMAIDPNKLSPDGSISLPQVAPAPDGKLLAYTLSEGGADWQTIHVRNLTTGRDVVDRVDWVRFSLIAWTHDGKGFFYSRFPAPPPGKQLEAALGVHALYYHRVGTPQSKDRLIFERKQQPNWFVSGSVTEDGRYLIIRFSPGATPRNRLYYVDLGKPKQPNIEAPIKTIVDTEDAAYWTLGNANSKLYLVTDLNAPKRRVIAVDLKAPERSNWKTIIPEASDAVEDSTLAGGRIAVSYLVDVESRIKLFTMDGRELSTVALPGVGTVGELNGRYDSPELIYSFTSPLYPSTVYFCEGLCRASRAFEDAKPKFDPTNYEVKQFFAVSKDGTRVPYFVTARKNTPLNGDNPTRLYGYGGFSINLTPSYSPDVPAWLERGGIHVTANIRGGGEYGEDWHRNGMLDKKKNSFDDFIAVAEDLIRRGYTSPTRLAIQGASNGGLLVAAVVNQRPDLFAAALPAVGVMDMLRYEKFTGGTAWVVEYGAWSDPDMFPVLFKYSPLHNLKRGTCYPAVLVTTADHDDRVVPSHSFKYIATLQAAQGCERPALMRVETQSSHGYRPTDKRITELADMWTFIAAQTAVPKP